MWVKKGDIYIAHLPLTEITNPQFVVILKDSLPEPNKITAVKLKELKEERRSSRSSDAIYPKSSRYIDTENLEINSNDVIILDYEDLMKYIGTVDYSTINKIKAAIPEEIRRNPEYFPPKQKKQR